MTSKNFWVCVMLLVVPILIDILLGLFSGIEGFECWCRDSGAQQNASKYSTQDYVVWSSPDVDLPGNPIKGTSAQCQAACSSQAACLGYSRGKGVSDDTVGECYLKKKLSPAVANNSAWQTLVKS